MCFRSQRNWSNVLQFDILLIKIFCRLKVSYIVWYGNDVKDTQNIYDGVYITRRNCSGYMVTRHCSNLIITGMVVKLSFVFMRLIIVSY